MNSLLNPDRAVALTVSLAAHALLLALLKLWTLAPGSEEHALTVTIAPANAPSSEGMGRPLSDAKSPRSSATPNQAENHQEKSSPSSPEQTRIVETINAASPTPSPRINPIRVPEIPTTKDLASQTEEAENSPNAKRPEVVRKAAPPMSGYQAHLLKQINEKRYHAARENLGTVTDTQTAVLRIKLHANGTLIKARIEQSSGNPKLDSHFLNITLNASPFSPPPLADASTGYEYLIPLKYQQ